MNLRNVSVRYLKGKYSYKKAYLNLNTQSNKVYFAGPIEPMEPVFAKILTQMRSFMRDQDRLSNESRKSLRFLEHMMKDPNYYFKKEGITHIIIYEHV